MVDLPLFPRANASWFVAWPAMVLGRLLYNVRARGVERVPAQGGALIVSNHLSYVDVFALQLACPRPIRFVGHEAFPRRSWFFRLAYKLTGTIPVSPANALDTVRRVSQALKAGELVLIFPEGGISRTGHLMKLQRGFEMMARKAGVPVVPVAHDGMWGSVFSFSDNKYLLKSPRIMRTAVCVAWGEPIPADQADAATVRQALLDLGCEAFDDRPQLKRHLGGEIVRRLGRHPGLLVMVDRTAGRREMTAAQLFAAAAGLSRHVRKTVPERRVGIVLPPGAGATIANLAVLCAGKVPVNFNFTAGRSASESSLRMSGVKTVITADAVRAKVPSFPWPERTLDLATTIKDIGGKRALLPWLLAAWLLPNQLLPRLLGLPKQVDRDAEAGLLFTSGSSGEPKGVALTHRNILANCWQFSTLSLFPSDSVMLSCLPVFHSFGFTVNMWYPLLRGCHSVTVPSPLEPKKIIDAIREEEVSVMVGAPTFLRPILKKAEPADLKSLQILVSGAEKMPMDLYEGFLEKFHLEIMQGYGMTEASPGTNVNQPDPVLPTETATEQPGKCLGSVGRMMAGMTARVFNPETLEVLAPGETGVIAFRGANVFGGYLDDPKKTAEVFHDGWYVTGDLGHFDEDGFLFIEGRLSRFSKIAGEMVPHGTVEQKLLEAFALDQAEGYALVVMGVPDPGKGEQLVLLTANDAVTAESVKEKLGAAGVPNLWIPKIVSRVEKIPVLGTGKLDLKGCKDLAAAAAGAEGK